MYNNKLKFTTNTKCTKWISSCRHILKWWKLFYDNYLQAPETLSYRELQTLLRHKQKPTNENGRRLYDDTARELVEMKKINILQQTSFAPSTLLTPSHSSLLLLFIVCFSFIHWNGCIINKYASGSRLVLCKTSHMGTVYVVKEHHNFPLLFQLLELWETHQQRSATLRRMINEKFNFNLKSAWKLGS